MQNQYRDLIKLYADREYTGKIINLNNVSHSRIRELEILGETTEVGEGTKSPDNPFTLVSATNPSVNVNGQTVQTNVLLNSAGSVADSYNPITGEYVQRIGILVLNGSEDWNEGEKLGDSKISIRFYTSKISNLVKKPNNNLTIPNIIGTHYNKKNTYDVQFNYNQSVSISSSGNLSIRDFFDNLQDFKTFLSAQYATGTPVTVLYELATPITTIINQTEITANIPNTAITISEAKNLGSIRAVLQTKGA